MRPPDLDPARHALFLDLDGALAPIMPRPADVVPDAARTALVLQLRRAFGERVAVISGRALADIDRILDRATPAAAGVHGLERRRASGTLAPAAGHASVAAAREVLLAAARGLPGTHLEDKGLSVALHYRQAPEHADACLAAAQRAVQAAPGLMLQHGHAVVEARPEGGDKGKALIAFLHEPPFKGATPVFIGDDVTDEAGFAAARAHGGFGVFVGAAPTGSARYALPDPAAVARWLDAAAKPLPVEARP